jgi:hypothetical protein
MLAPGRTGPPKHLLREEIGSIGRSTVRPGSMWTLIKLLDCSRLKRWHASTVTGDLFIGLLFGMG